MPFQTYDPQKVIVTVNNQIVSGFAPDSIVKVMRNEDGFTLSVGADGRGARSKNANHSGTIEIDLKSDSPSNDVLSALAVQDELSGTGVSPAQVKDGTGTTLCQAANCWIKKFADVELGKEIGTRTWILESDAIDIFVGGTAAV